MFFDKIVPVERTNKKWEVLYETRSLTLPLRQMFTKEDTFFTIGSCFAEEVRKALSSHGIVCLPQYSKVTFDPDHAIVDTLPLREHMNFYNTFSIAQELSRATGNWEQDPLDHWTLTSRRILGGKLVGSDDKNDKVFQDPYRRLVFADSVELLHDITSQISNIFRVGLTQCSVLIITLGMTEVFRKKDNNKVCNQVPVYGGGGGLRETEFYKSTYEDNLVNMRTLLEDFKSLNPNARVVLSVSPVPLHRSFGSNDIFVNNYASKCTLRAVAEQISDEYSWVSYFPSFEAVWNMGSSAYQERDLLHVKPKVVETIIKSFIGGFFKQSPLER